MTIIRTTCPDCGDTTELRAAQTVLELPAPGADDDAEPRLVHLCPSCSAACITPVSWRMATYLGTSGATTLLGPDEHEARPDYPERRPFAVTPLTLDDLIALHQALDAPGAFL